MMAELVVSRRPDGLPEICYSVQGEGVNLGKPAVFLRLGHCNLACTWCDTKYTWDWEQYDPGQQLTEMSANEIEHEISRHNCRHLVVTGGEPMIQQKPLLALLRSLKNGGWAIEIETNGTIVPDPQLVDLVDYWSVSPKFGNSGNLPSRREIPEAYRFFANLRSCHFKYVIQQEDDLTEVQNLNAKYKVDPLRTILMPEAVDRDVLLDRGAWLVELCKSHGYLFSTRLQVLIWGNRRGV